jgi:hypothetical protein
MENKSQTYKRNTYGQCSHNAVFYLRRQTAYSAAIFITAAPIRRDQNQQTSEAVRLLHRRGRRHLRLQNGTGRTLFSIENGLTVDGKVGNQTFKALGMMSYVSGSSSSSSDSSSSGSGSYTSESDVMLLAKGVNGEARGEPYVGQVAVAAVILNRVDSSDFSAYVSAP